MNAMCGIRYSALSGLDKVQRHKRRASPCVWILLPFQGSLQVATSKFSIHYSSFDIQIYKFLKLKKQ